MRNLLTHVQRLESTTFLIETRTTDANLTTNALKSRLLVCRLRKICSSTLVNITKKNVGQQKIRIFAQVVNTFQAMSSFKRIIRRLSFCFRFCGLSHWNWFQTWVILKQKKKSSRLKFKSKIIEAFIAIYPVNETIDNSKINCQLGQTQTQKERDNKERRTLIKSTLTNRVAVRQ